MNEQELTSIFPPDVFPVHVGPYEISMWDYGFDRYSYWNGNYWSITAGTPEDAASSEGAISNDCYSEGFNGWRGLAKEPK